MSRLIWILLCALLSVLSTANPSSAACVGNTCSLGGGLRYQIGNDLSIPLNGLPNLGNGLIEWGAGGLIVPMPGATIMQQDPAVPGSPRSLMLAPGQMTFDAPPAASPVFVAPDPLLQIGTNLDFSFPNAANGTRIFEAGGRPGPVIVTWCPGQPPPSVGFNPGCVSPGVGTVNGLVRYTATRNQFGGAGRPRIDGDATRFFNVAGAALPCAGVGCTIAVSRLVAGGFTGAAGGNFVETTTLPPVPNPTGVFTATVGPLGTVLAIGLTATDGMGNPIPFVGPGATTWGVPFTTGMITISVSQPLPSVVMRTGNDVRLANGEGLVTMVSGGLSSRTLGSLRAGAPPGSSVNSAVLTLNVPEPNSMLGALAVLTGIFLGSVAVRARRGHRSADQ